MSVTIHKLQSKTLSRKCKDEIKKIIPCVESIIKRHTPGCGYVFYVKSKNQENLGHCYLDHGVLKLSVK